MAKLEETPMRMEERLILRDIVMKLGKILLHFHYNQQVARQVVKPAREELHQAQRLILFQTIVIKIFLLFFTKTE